MKKIIIILFLFLGFLPSPVYAEDLLENQLDSLDLENVDARLDDGTSFSSMVRNIISGEYSFSFKDLPDTIGELAFGEFKAQGRLLTQLLLVVILSAVLKQLSGSFHGKSVGEMGFYVCYMVLIVVIITSFYSLSSIVVERVDHICKVFLGMLPAFLVLSVSGGNFTQTALMGPTIMGGSTVLTFGIRDFIIPAILLAVALEMADHISEKPILSRFAQLFRQGISWVLKGAAILFMLLLSLQKVGGGALNGLAAKTARIAVGSVPVVGDVMGGAVETAAAVAGTLKSGTLAAAAIFLLLLCIPLLVKLAVILLVFKVTAAAAEFICEERLVDCISAAGDYTALLLGVVFLAEGMFLFSALLLLGGF
ncbi:stage III sporulation protein AE [Anaerotignum sp.]|uniref:stage III sporulation protein AE n=1 Tax=Anaerotignum sp. TaxID=2039241 RepID=UPI0027152566|nr:stage III sporulation protein AE [Anaerotignum sp.]